MSSFIERFMRPRVDKAPEALPVEIAQILRSYVALERQIAFREAEESVATAQRRRTQVYSVYTRLLSLLDMVRSNGILDQEIPVSTTQDFSTYFVTGREEVDIGLRRAPIEPINFISVGPNKSKAARLDPNIWCQESQTVRAVAKGALSRMQSGHRQIIISASSAQTNLI